MTDSRSFIEIMLAQSTLQQRGHYHGPIDGKPSQSVRQALLGFQKEDGFELTGELDDKLFRRLLELRQEMAYSIADSRGSAGNGKSSLFAQIAECLRRALGTNTA